MMPACRSYLLALAMLAATTPPALADDEDWWDWYYDEDDETATPPAAHPDGTLPPANGSTQRFASGKLVLPLHGIEIELPSLGATSGDYYLVGGYWRLEPNGETHSVSHVIDEFVGARLQGGTSIQLGSFSDKTCATMAAEFKVEGPWTTTFELFGRSWTAQGGIQVRASGARVPAVFMCTEIGMERLLVRRYFNADATLPDAGGTRARLAALPTLQAIVRAYEKRVRVASRGIKDPMVTRQDKSLPASRTVTLGHVGLTVTLPDDEHLWTIEQTPKYEGQDILFRAAPYVHPTDVTLFRMRDEIGCEAAFSRLARGDKARWDSASGVPAGWRSRVAFADAGYQGVYLCRDMTGGPLVAAISTRGATPDLDDLRRLLAAIATAAGPEPAVNEQPATPPPTPRPYEREETFFAGGWFLEVPLSSRDTAKLGLDEARFPSFNYAGPGFGMSMAFGEVGSWIGRFALWGSPAWSSLLIDEDETSSPRFGAQHWEASLEYGLNLELGDRAALGLTLGWTGLSGPITKNSSLSASLVFASVAEDFEDTSFVLRVTPVQILAANERMFMSPLAAELMLFIDGFAFGAELQYIAAPEAGDEDIVAEAWALILRLGIGLGTR